MISNTRKICPLVAAAVFFAGLLCMPAGIRSQELLSDVRIWGNFELEARYYFQDSLIGAPEVPEKILMNGFANVNVSYSGFTVGFRYESYQNALLGYDPRYSGNGIPYRFASYTQDNLEITLGNFYEQFGSGLVFRTCRPSMHTKSMIPPQRIISFTKMVMHCILLQAMRQGLWHVVVGQAH